VADLGPGPPELIRKRITTEISRLEFSIASQELEMMEHLETIERIKGNIEASEKELDKAQFNLEALDKEEVGE